MENVKTIAIIVGIVLIISAVVYTGVTVSGAAVKQQTSGVICCTFDRDGEQKTCVAPDGQECGVCDSVCAASGG